MISTIKYILVLILLIIVLYTDTKSYKIKNSTVIFFAIIGLLCNCLQFNLVGAFTWLIGTIVPMVVLFILFVLNMLGAGDIKLISVIGGLLGLNFLIKASLYMLIVAGIMALIKMIIKRNFFIRIKYLINYFHNIIINKQIGKYDELRRDRNHVVRLSYAIGAGTLYQIIIDLKVFA